MQILLISGSQRSHSKSVEVAKLIQRNILDGKASVSSEIVELSAYPSLLAHYGSDAEKKMMIYSKIKLRFSKSFMLAMQLYLSRLSGEG